jgi:hypothetical protein
LSSAKRSSGSSPRRRTRPRADTASSRDASVRGAPPSKSAVRRSRGRLSRTRSPSLRATTRKPSCFISCSQASPLGGCGALSAGMAGRSQAGGACGPGQEIGGYARMVRSRSKLEGVEIITCPPLGSGTGKNRHIAGTIIIEVFNAPFSGAVAVFDDGDILLKRVAHQQVLESQR